jgi:methylmalonyl-CoA/ethylmalonyl-CoA epimerase
VPDLVLAKARHELIVKGARVEAATNQKYGYEHNTLYMGSGPHDQSFELCHTVDPTRPMGRFYQRWGPGLYMITLDVRDLPGVIAGLRRRGVEHIPEPGDPPRVAYIHPKETPGCFIGLLEPR